MGNISFKSNVLEAALAGNKEIYKKQTLPSAPSTLNEKDIKDNKKLKLTLAALAVAGIAAVGVAAYKGKSVKLKSAKKGSKNPFNKYKTKGGIIFRTTSKPTKSGYITTEYLDVNGNVIKRITENNSERIRTTYNRNIKNVYTENFDQQGVLIGGRKKEFIKAKGKKHKLVRREIRDINENNYKLVEHFPNGLSGTVLKDKNGVSFIFRDKKGNIIDAWGFGKKPPKADETKITIFNNANDALNYIPSKGIMQAIKSSNKFFNVFNNVFEKFTGRKLK